jgi:CheY-like chemotaxis protein
MLKTEVILLVQDEETDALLIERAIRKLHWSNPVKHLPDGEQALAYLGLQAPFAPDEPRPALVLLDLKMPGCSGLDVLSWARHQPDLDQVAIVIFTGSSDGHFRDEAMNRGADGYVIMPVTFDEMTGLLAGLARFLPGASEGAPSAA